MSRQRMTHKWLPKYVSIRSGSYWWQPTGMKAEPMHDSKGNAIRAGDESAMYRWVADKLKDIPSGPIYTLNDAFDRYEREVIPTLQPRTQRDYRRHIVVLRRTFGHMGPNDVLPKDIGKFLSVEKGKIHRNRIAGVLSAVYTKLVSRWYEADRNPCFKVERNKSKPRDRLVTNAEFDAFYSIANKKLQVAMDLALLTGQRRGDLLALKWSQVTPEGVTFRQGKTGKRLRVTMSPALQTVLERARRFAPDLPREYVLRRRSGQPYTADGFSAMWQRAMRKYGKAGHERFTFHDLRGKSGSDAVSIQDAYERLGHTSISMTRRVYDRGVRDVKPLK